MVRREDFANEISDLGNGDLREWFIRPGLFRGEVQKGELRREQRNEKYNRHMNDGDLSCKKMHGTCPFF